jgi:hypothetical protein
MVSAKRLVQMARKWQRMAALARKSLMPLMSVKAVDGSSCSTSSVAGKGHCVVYSADGRRFEVPLLYLSTRVFGELLTISQEFGFASDDGRITLPCDTVVMEYILCLLRREASEEVERAFLNSMVRPCHCGNGLRQTWDLARKLLFLSSKDYHLASRCML